MSKRSRSLLIVLCAIALTLGLLDLRGGPITRGVRAVGTFVMGPLQTVSGALANPFVGWIQGAGEFRDPAERTRLWQEQAPAAAQVRTDQRLAEFNQMLGILQATQLAVIPARVVAYPTNPVDLDTVVIDVGSSAGVSNDIAVISGAGLVGRTTRVGSGVTDVMLLSAPNSAVGGRFLRTGEACVISGTGDPNELTVRVVDPTADVQVGDPVITFGSKSGAPFPADLPIGTVSAIDTDGAGGRVIKLQPAADLAALDLVAVLFPPGVTPERAPIAVPNTSSEDQS